MGMLSQMLGSWRCPVACLSKQLDPIVRGGPPGLHALATATLVVLEGDELTPGQGPTVWVPHSVLTLTGIALSRTRSTTWDISHRPRNSH